MAKNFIARLFGAPSSESPTFRLSRTRRIDGHHRLTFESLETRRMLSTTPITDLTVSASTGEKPQSKAWEYQGTWYSVLPNKTGTWLWRLDGAAWTPQLKLSTNTSSQADVLAEGDLTYILLFEGTASQFATVQFNTGLHNYQVWSQQPQLASVSLSSGVETATLALDSAGRMWIASDAKTSIEVRYSDGNYTQWSAPITLATGVTTDDISSIIAMPNQEMGVSWSNQNTQRFGFRLHVDGASPTQWSNDEVPASQSALKKGAGFADDHVHMAVASNGTLYVAAKTGYDSAGFAAMILLVRRPNGVWDNAYTVDGGGTRPVVVLNEAANELVVAYTSQDGGGNILYRVSPMDVISLSPVHVLISGTINNVTTTKQEFTDDVVFLAEGGGKAKGVEFRLDGFTPPQGPVNQAPLVNAGADQSITFGSSLQLAGVVTDDNLPNPPGTVSITWTKISGSGNVSFTDAASATSGASFSLPGQYVLRLTANDGTLSASDDVTVNVVDPNAPVTASFQDGQSPALSYQGTRDTKLDSGSKKSNFGTATTLVADGSPDVSDLLYWDIGSIPAGSVIESATIQLNATTTGKQSYPLYAMNRVWDELSATWNQAATGSPWATPGASGAADHGSTAVGQFSAPKTGVQQIVLNQGGLTALQAWISNPASNFGLILQGYANSDDIQFSASETRLASQRPKLIITYHPPASQMALVAHISAPVNEAPQVSAGGNQTTHWPAAATLQPSMSDDGWPSQAALTVGWSKVSGSGTVTFANALAANTSAQFHVQGTYFLRLTVSDGLPQSSSDLTITVLPPLVPIV